MTYWSWYFYTSEIVQYIFFVRYLRGTINKIWILCNKFAFFFQLRSFYFWCCIILLDTIDPFEYIFFCSFALWQKTLHLPWSILRRNTNLPKSPKFHSFGVQSSRKLLRPWLRSWHHHLSWLLPTILNLSFSMSMLAPMDWEQSYTRLDKMERSMLYPMLVEV